METWDGDDGDAVVDLEGGNEDDRKAQKAMPRDSHSETRIVRLLPPLLQSMQDQTRQTATCVVRACGGAGYRTVGGLHKAVR